MMKNNIPDGLKGLSSPPAVLVAEIFFGFFCLGFALFLFYGSEQGLPRGIFGMAFAITIIGSSFLTRAIEGFKLKNRIKRFVSTPTDKSAEQSGPAYPPQGVGSADP